MDGITQVQVFFHYYYDSLSPRADHCTSSLRSLSLLSLLPMCIIIVIINQTLRYFRNNSKSNNSFLHCYWHCSYRTIFLNNLQIKSKISHFYSTVVSKMVFSLPINAQKQFDGTCLNHATNYPARKKQVFK